MNLNQLIERLEEIRESVTAGGELEVRLAVQPNYPIVETLRGVAGPEEFLNAFEDKDDSDEEFSTERGERAGNVVWLVSGGQPSKFDESPYAPGWVFGAVE